MSVVGVAMILSALVAPAEARRHPSHKSHAARAGAYSPPYSAMVVDAKTGRVLYGENEDELRHPASITKVMTLYLLFEQLERGRYRLDSPLQVSAWAERQAPSKLGLRAGQTIAVEDAIKALVTKSANDAAVTVAENIGGSEPAFAEMMTRKARQLGMSRTVYKNASGLPDDRQVTSARDLITLGRAIQERFPRYYAYFGTYSFAYRGAVHRNHNKLLGQVEGVDGIKTGYTRMSGFNLLTSARRADGRHLIAVVLGGRSGAARDRQMAELITGGMNRAYAGAKTAAPIAEVAAVDSAEPEPIRPAAPRQQPPETPVTTAAIATPAAKPQAAAPRLAPIRAAATRPVVASAQGTATATPNSLMRWQVGAPPAAQVKAKAEPQAETRIAKIEPQKPMATPVGGWVIQLGATDDEAKANDILQRAKAQGRGVLAKASPFTEKIMRGGSPLYRARFSGFDAEDAQQACKTLTRSGFSCFATKG